MIKIIGQVEVRDVYQVEVEMPEEQFNWETYKRVRELLFEKAKEKYPDRDDYNVMGIEVWKDGGPLFQHK